MGKNRLLVWFGAILGLSNYLLGITPEFFFNSDAKKTQILKSYYLTQSPKDYFSDDENLALGIYYYFAGNFTKAELYLNRARSLNPNSLSFYLANFYLAELYLKQKAYLKALNALKAIDTNCQDLPKDYLLYSGVCYYQLGNYDQALRYLSNFQQVSVGSENYQVGILYLALASLSNGDYKQTNEILAQDSLFPDSTYQTIRKYLQALNYLLQGKLVLSKNLLNELIVDNPQVTFSPYIELLLGKIYFEERDYHNALKKFSSAYRFNVDPIKTYAGLYLALSHLKIREYDKALTMLDSLENSLYEDVAVYYKARILEQQAKRRKAQSEYKKLVAKYPANKTTEYAYLNLFRLLLDEENYQEFIALAQEFINNFPASPEIQNVLYRVIEASYKLNQDAKVEAYAEKFLTDFAQAPQADEVRFYLAAIKLKNNKTREAQSHLVKITDRKLYPYAQKIIGDLYLKADSLTRALEFYVRAERSGTDSIVDIARLAQKEIYYRMGRYQSKIAMLEEFLTEYPSAYNASRIQYEIAESLFNRGEFAQALVAYQKARNYRTSRELVSEILWREGNCYEHLDNLDSAIIAYEQLLNFDKNFTHRGMVLKRLTQLYENQGNYEKAIFYYQELIKSSSHNDDQEAGYLGLAKIYQKFNRLLEARTILKQFISEFSNSARAFEAYLMLSEVSLLLGDYKESEKYAQTLVKKFKKFGEGYFQLGKIYQAQNKYKDAVLNFELASKYYGPEKGALALFEAGKSAMAGKQYQEAQRYFTQAMQMTTDERLRLECERLLAELSTLDK
ncbi:MAG: tetratricopeptide repeat protein [candidate division WOR-3 bacterium]